MKRVGEITRKTRETEINVVLNLDGQGKSKIETGIGFFNHMLESLACHSMIDLTVLTKGDLHVDEHHTVEDTGIAIGEALKSALGAKKGIRRFGWAYCPMDEALARTAIDISGRPHCVCELGINLYRIGNLHTETIPEFFKALATNSGMSLHIDLIRGKNLHHIIEAIFKSFAKALQIAITCQVGNKSIPSTKGTLSK